VIAANKSVQTTGQKKRLFIGMMVARCGNSEKLNWDVSVTS